MALGDDTAVGVEDRHFVRAVPGTVLASDTAGVIMKDDPVVKLDVALGRTPFETLGIDTVVTAHGVKKLKRVGKRPHLHLTHTPPLDIGRVAVLLVTGNLTAVTPDTRRRIEMKTVLLPGLELGDIDGVAPALHTGIVLVVDEAL
jgi:hypothetical protein